MKWISTQLPVDERVHALAQSLSKPEADFPLPLANILVQRGVETLAQAQQFFKPTVAELHSPWLMADMEIAVARLLKAHASRERILIYGDYDVDGTTSVTLLVRFLRSQGFEIDYYVPDRYAEGYGISYVGVDYGTQQGATLMVVLDCGTKEVEKVRYAAKHGMECIICDHHTVGSTRPEAVALLNPKRPDCGYPFKELTGCGIGLKLCMALAERLSPENPDAPLAVFREYCDLAALSTACDIVPMVDENRAIAHFGLEKIKNAPSIGIAAIKNLSETERIWDISDLVFFIGPRVNAAGRILHARGAVKVLLGEETAEGLDVHNDERKGLDEQITQQALELIAADSGYASRATTVLHRDDWHKGVIGIVASRLIEQHYRPTILFTHSNGRLVGSARSVQGYDLYAALEQCSQHLLQFGGHKFAAGMTLRPELFEAFREDFDRVVAASIQPDQREPRLLIDHTLNFAEIDPRFVRLMNLFAPFGPENHAPVFFADEVEVHYTTIMKQEHLKLTVSQWGTMFEAVGFFLAKKWQELGAPNRIRLAFQPSFETFNGKASIKLRIKDMQAQ